MSLKLYTLGFMFDDERQRVVLVFKARPAWQAGKLNGVGGQLEQGETPIDAMVREFREETGVQTAPTDWVQFGQLQLFPTVEKDCPVILATALIVLFRGRNTQHVDAAQTCTDENVCVAGTQGLSTGIFPQVPNLVWLVEAARDYDPALHATRHPFSMTVAYTAEA